MPLKIGFLPQEGADLVCGIYSVFRIYRTHYDGSWHRLGENKDKQKRVHVCGEDWGRRKPARWSRRVEKVEEIRERKGSSSGDELKKKNIRRMRRRRDMKNIKKSARERYASSNTLIFKRVRLPDLFLTLLIFPVSSWLFTVLGDEQLGGDITATTRTKAAAHYWQC